MARNNKGTKEDPIVLMELGDDYESVEGQDWEAKDYKVNLPVPRVPFFELIRDAPFGIPTTNIECCEQWLICQSACHYGIDSVCLSQKFCY